MQGIVLLWRSLLWRRAFVHGLAGTFLATGLRSHRLARSGVLRIIHGGVRSDVLRLTAVQKGRYGTGPAPYGYRRGRDEEKPLVVDDREAEVVRTIFREYLRTKSTGKVVGYLHTHQVFTRKGNKWSRQAIAIILSNRTYRGRVSYGEVETQGLHAPIIEPALFYKANAIRQCRRRRGFGSETIDGL